MEHPVHRTDDPDQRLLVPGRFVPEPCDQPVAPQSPDHAADIGLVDGQHPDCHVMQEFDQFPAKADRNHFPECRVRLPPDDQFEPGRKLLFDHDPGDHGTGLVVPDILPDLPECLPYLTGRSYAGDHPPGIALVDDIREITFITTGYPAACAAISASSTVRATWNRGIGTPAVFRSSYPSASESNVRTINSDPDKSSPLPLLMVFISGT